MIPESCARRGVRLCKGAFRWRALIRRCSCQRRRQVDHFNISGSDDQCIRHPDGYLRRFTLHLASPCPPNVVRSPHALADNPVQTCRPRDQILSITHLLPLLLFNQPSVVIVRLPYRLGTHSIREQLRTNHFLQHPKNL